MATQLDRETKRPVSKIRVSARRNLSLATPAPELNFIPGGKAPLFHGARSGWGLQSEVEVLEWGTESASVRRSAWECVGVRGSVGEDAGGLGRVCVCVRVGAGGILRAWE